MNNNDGFPGVRIKHVNSFLYILCKVLNYKQCSNNYGDEIHMLEMLITAAVLMVL